MKLKGYKPLEKEVNKLTKKFGCTAFLGTDFGYYPATQQIEFSLVVNQTDDAYFLASIKRLSPAVIMDIFLWSLLHEIGHSETYDDITMAEYEIDRLTKEQINKGEIARTEYYNCTDERLATAWAVWYANSHAIELEKQWKRIQKAIIKFYKKNKIIY